MSEVAREQREARISPTPWRTERRGFGYPDYEGGPVRRLLDVVAADGAPVAVGTGVPESDANMELVGDAPALLDALEVAHRKMEREAAVSEWAYMDHGCAECVPGGEIVKEGFQCARHLIAALLRKHGRL